MGPSIIDVLLEYYPIFLKGALGTLKIAAIAVGFGTLLGTIFGFLHLSQEQNHSQLCLPLLYRAQGNSSVGADVCRLFFHPHGLSGAELPEQRAMRYAFPNSKLQRLCFRNHPRRNLLRGNRANRSCKKLRYEPFSLHDAHCSSSSSARYLTLFSQ